MSREKDHLEFPTRTEEDGSTSILVEGRMYIRNVHQKKVGGDIYGEFQGDPCVVTTILGEGPVVIVCSLAENDDSKD